MVLRMDHMNINTLDLEKSLAFYMDAFDLKVVRRHEDKDGRFKLVYLTDASGVFQLEITWLKDRSEPYDLSDNEIHLCFRTDDIKASLARHRAMGVVSMENESMGVYFVADPDGYWVEVAPEK